MPKGTYQMMLAQNIAPAGAVLAIDGTNSSSLGTNSASNTSSGLVTTQTNDLICAVVEIDNGVAAFLTSTVTGGGLTWTLQKRVQFTGRSFHTTVEFWTAPSAGTLSSPSITATYNTPVTGSGVSIIRVFGVSGVNFAAAVDAVAGTAQSEGASTQPTVNITTSNAHDMIVSVILNDYGGGTTLESGFTNIVPASNTTSEMISFKVVTTTQTAFAVNSGSNTTNWAVIAVAIAGT